MTRVATANLPARRMTDDELSCGISDVLAKRPTYLALQEVGPDRNNVLRRVGEEYGYRLARGKGGPPVLYESHSTEVLRARSVTLAPAQVVGKLIGRKSALGASKGTLVLFEDDEHGEVAVINFHLTAEVQYGGGYREDKAHRARVRRHKREVRKLGRVARRQVRKGRAVYALGDGNYDGLRIRGLVSCWVGQPHTGTLGRRAVDAVFSTHKSRLVTTVATGSDHRAVISDYL